MNTNKTTLIVFALLSLTSCSRVSNMFSDADERPPMEGERISVLQLQKKLTAETPLKDGEEFALPRPWQNQAWPQAGGYPNHSMQNLAISPDPLKKIWSSKIGKGSTSSLPLNAQPIAADGLVFTLDTRAKLSAFEADTGKKIWTLDVSSEKEDDAVITGGIAYAHATIFVTNGYDEALAISPKNGEILWRKTLPSPSRAAPSILSGRVYISTIDSRLIALNANDGSSLWEYRGMSETAGLLGAASPAVNQDIVLAAFSSGEITALRVENGSVAWSDNLSSVKTLGGGLESMSDITAMPISDQGLAIAMSFGGKLVAIDERSGNRIWQREIGGSQTPWIAGNTMYVLSSENQLIGISLLDGAIFWITELDRFEDEDDMDDPVQWGSPLLADGRLILASSHGQLIEVNPHNGEVMQKTKTKNNVQISPIVANNTLYLLSESGSLIAYQ